MSDNESRSTKWGSRINPRFPMLYETHRPMVFDQARGGDQTAYAEGWDRIFGKKTALPVCDQCRVEAERLHASGDAWVCIDCLSLTGE